MNIKKTWRTRSIGGERVMNRHWAEEIKTNDENRAAEENTSLKLT